MIARNGIRSTLRARGRTALFTLLILVLTLALVLGIGMWAYCARALAVMDESYTSIALLEYMGGDYPDINAADEFARQAAQTLDDRAIEAIQGVERWERTSRFLVSPQGYSRYSGEMRYGKHAVLAVSRLSPVYHKQFAQLLPEELPEYFLAEGGDGNFCRVRLPWIEETDLPLFYMMNGAYMTNVQAGDGSGALSFEKVDPEELPEAFVYYNQNRYQYVLHTPGGTRALGDDIDSGMIYYRDTDQYWGMAERLYAYTGMVSRDLYSLEGMADQFILLEVGDTGFVPERDSRYLIHGMLTSGDTGHACIALSEFYQGCTTPPYLKINNYDQPDVPDLTQGIFVDYAEYYRLANNYAYLETSDDIASLEVFHQNELYLEQGRFPAAGEAGVCVISGSTAQRMGVSLGDTVQLSLLDASAGDWTDVTVSGQSRTLEVVGVTNANQAYEGWFWASMAEKRADSPFFGYHLGRVVLDNAAARQAAARLERLVPDQVRVTLYDQGYTAAAQPLETMQTTAMAVTAASACGALAVLVLFAFLFVGRQRETVSVLTSLGTPAGKIRLWLLSGGALIAAVAALLGGVMGALTLERIVAAALSAARSLYSADLRYSEAAVGVVREAVEAASAPLWPAAAATGAVLAAAVLLCLVFLRQSLRQSTPKRGKLTVRTPKSGTSVTGRGAARFALQSARRGGWRSGVVPAAALVLSLFLGVLTAGAAGWEAQLDDLYDNSRIQGQLVNTSGRSFSNLTVSAKTARELWNSGALSQLAVSVDYPYWMAGDMPAFADSGFGEESRAVWINEQPRLVAVNDLSAAPEFYYMGTPAVQWLEGWDEGMFSQAYTNFYRTLTYSLWDGATAHSLDGEEAPVYPVLASTSLMERKGLALGDSASIQISFNAAGMWEMFPLVQVQVVGSFVRQGEDENIYIPLSFAIDPELLTGREDRITDMGRPPLRQNIRSMEDLERASVGNLSFRTGRFTLNSARSLDEFRGYLQERGYSQVGVLGSNRTTVLLRDQTFTETVGGLGRYITFSQILFPVLFLMVGLLGFIISWLMVNGRRMEFAVMRGLGASRGRVFLSFFLEQGLLCLLGCGAGSVILLFLPGGGARWLAVAAFLLCYLAGCALSVLAVGRTHLMSLLSERE